jgi:methylenetetrahydrofolate dehydrogenase (NADP+)/methenyltetrahydrofolate cyclohydrolase
MNAKPLDGRTLAISILGEAKRAAARARKRLGRAPRLAVVASGGGAADSYLKMKLRACANVGIETVVHRLSPGPRAKTLGLLADFIGDSAVDALIIDTPYPRGLTAADVTDLIPSSKDAEGVTAQTYGRLFLAKSWDEAASLVGPCTALAIARLLAASKIRLAGRRAVVIGRSATVGRPAAHLLSTFDLTVTLAHARTQGLAALCREADVVVAAAGVPGFVKPTWIKRGALVIDAGIHMKGGKIIGDCAQGVGARAGLLTPVPGGVGPVTTAVLVLQAALLAERR